MKRRGAGKGGERCEEGGQARKGDGEGGGDRGREVGGERDEV